MAALGEGDPAWSPMILLDADLLLLDIRYPRDVRFSLNEQFLKTLQERGLERVLSVIEVKTSVSLPVF